MKEGKMMTKEKNEILKYRTKDIEEGVQLLINGELPEDKEKLLKEDLVKQLEELKKILIEL